MCIGGEKDAEDAVYHPLTEIRRLHPVEQRKQGRPRFFVPSTMASEDAGTSGLETSDSVSPEERNSLRTSTSREAATTTTLSSSKGCSRCRNSNLSCGEIAKENATDVICTCIKPLSNGEYSSCYLSRGMICIACYDGTPCGQKNPGGYLCRCDQKVGEDMYLACFLGKPTCTNCSDGTPCGDLSKDGKGCFCYPPCQGQRCEYDRCELK